MAACRKSRWWTAALVALFALLLVVAVAVHVAPRSGPVEAACVPTRPDTSAVQPSAHEEEAADFDEVPENDGNEDGEERLVDDFYAETDKWTAADVSGGKPPTVDDALAFAVKFRALPGERKEECLQRALNLVPDENVMVLVGILMDKTQEREFIQLVFDDILNRPEDVKMPILERILSDKKHPCNADAKWIFDVTGNRAQDI